MPHQRSRAILPVLIKRSKLWPVVGVVGPRQCGKSVLLRDLFAPERKGEYITLDSLKDRERASSAPEAFAEPASARSVRIIDEIQKAPRLFDAIKFYVDHGRRPGMYVISGSTEFSKLTGIRESLTGRIGVLHLHPMTLGELHQKPMGGYFVRPVKTQASVPLAVLEQKLERGGMPGLCFLRDESEYALSCDAWLETTCYRDIHQVQDRRLDGGLALAILSQLVRVPEPTAAALARALKKDARVVQRHLDALEAILVIKKLSPHEAGVGKPHYLLCDVGIASHLGATRETQLRTHLLFEALAAFENAGLGRPILQYYRNAKTSQVPIVLSWAAAKARSQNVAIQFFDGESPRSRDMASLRAFSARVNGPMRLMLLTQAQESYADGEVEIYPLRG